MSHSTLSTPPPALSFRRFRSKFHTRFGMAEVTVIRTTLAKWESSPIAQDPAWSVDIQGERVTAVRLLL